MSAPPFDQFNLARHVGDKSSLVAANRKKLLQHCGGLEQIQWLNQVHGIDVVIAAVDGDKTADASFTRQAGLACAVMTADCLPVLFCDTSGQQVAAAHAGWRGLVAGVLEETLATFTQSREHILAWLGPAIGPQHFEVGAEVRAQFLDAAAMLSLAEQAFTVNPDKSNHYYADLYQLARLRLEAAGMKHIYGGQYCSYKDQQQFYSYRRDGATGRMATLIYKLAAQQ
ncbi:peptidoglycan editing factor PgeF [Oceanicoccus sp. KOV_DT_Chl]|uniref:peptidoglycan editing factor PgeF n=1 Tax=Oceanicoccus sp. KOV_DT_Chl TaxID=1904639 RepID=UPI001F347F36|nr:peptidoglycan editing factor PgeF [Oceanicoccus sp. KOV_DT_Chl]